MIAVEIVSIQAYNRLRHLLWRVCRSRRGLELVMRRAQRCAQCMSLGSRVQHLGALLEVLQALLQLKIGIVMCLRMRMRRRRLLGGRCLAILTCIEAGGGSQLRISIIGCAGRQLGWRRKDDYGRCASMRPGRGGL